MSFPNPFNTPNLSKSELSEREMIAMISEKVAEMMDQDPGLLFSYLYRLDVPEHLAEQAMKRNTEDVPIAIATLIWRRQKQRMETKKSIEVKKDSNWEGLHW